MSLAELCFEPLLVTRKSWGPACLLEFKFRCCFALPLQCPTECFWVLLGTWLRVPQRMLFEVLLALSWAPKVPKSTQKALFGALGARCPKALKSTLWGTFRPAPGHSCKWRPGSQHKLISSNLSGPPLTSQIWGFQSHCLQFTQAISACNEMITYLIPNKIKKLVSVTGWPLPILILKKIR